MRLSVNKGDPGWKPDHALRRYRVFFNGVELTDCNTADEERGFVIRQWPAKHPVTRKTVVQKSPLMRGVVTIKLRDAGLSQAEADKVFDDAQSGTP